MVQCLVQAVQLCKVWSRQRGPQIAAAAEGCSLVIAAAMRRTDCRAAQGGGASAAGAVQQSACHPCTPRIPHLRTMLCRSPKSDRHGAFLVTHQPQHAFRKQTFGPYWFQWAFCSLYADS